MKIFVLLLFAELCAGFEFELFMFHNNIVKISEQILNLLKTCLQVT